MEAPVDRGIVNTSSPFSVEETVTLLSTHLQSAGMTVFAHIDQQAAAQAVGLEMRAMILLVFGNPAAGTPLMKAHPSLAIDLPLKALVWEDMSGAVWITTNSPEYLKWRHDLPVEPFHAVDNIIAISVK